ncbi:chromate transporter [Ramlibacter sp.]|uniref:chromate transporter n=1 Tax=Ramlibacter sp. TaxID=1917967 RepID=UPI0035B0E97D
MSSPAATPPTTERPASLWEVFTSFTGLALQGFGGVLAVVQREMVEKRRWLTKEEFIEEWAVAQIMPGPNVVNLSLMLGARWFGLRGALTALAGMLVCPLLVVLALALVYARFAADPHVAGALRGMGAVAAGLVTATGIKLVPALARNPLGQGLCALFGVATFVAVAWLRLPLVAVLLVAGGLACVVAWRRIAP